VEKTAAGGNWFSGKATPDEKMRIDAISGSLTERYRKIAREREESYPQYMLLKLLSKSIYPLAVLSEIGKILNEFKKQNHLIHISEFNARIAGIVLDEPVPFIYERLGEKYRHLLIDEFQDTSALQWQNFVPLVENALSAGYFNLVVGDGKQAIYRWRNGDVEQFASLPLLPGSGKSPVVKDRERVLQDHYSERHLEKNFRSGREIVEFNNDFFKHLSTFLDSRRARVYEKLAQESEPAKGAGYIRIEFAGDSSGEATLREITLSKTAGLVRECISEGVPLKEIVILCRSNNNASDTARYLSGEGFPVVSSESLLLSFSGSVRFLAAMIRFLFEPANPVLESELLTWLHRSGLLGQADYHTLMASAGEDTRNSTRFTKILSENGITLRMEYLRSLPLYDLCEELIRLFSLDGSRDPYLEFFLENILKYTLKSPGGASGFLQWWEEKRENLSLIIPEGTDAIRIMTIHKAKGLQFPVVIFPFATDTLRSTRKYLWVDLEEHEVPGLPAAILPVAKEMDETRFAPLRQEEEQKSLLDMINLLYVVMTRAESRLYILTGNSSEKAETAKSLPDFFSGYLRMKGLWSDEKTVFEFGSKETQLPVNPAEPVLPERRPAMISADWRRRIFIRSHAPAVWDLEDPERNRRWGNLLHTVLSKIRDYRDTERVLSEIQLEGLAEREMIPGIRTGIEKLMENPEIRPFFEPGREVRTESEILLPDGNILRPDRVLIEGETATVVDYKSGKASEKHRVQLEIYEKHLLEMGYARVLKYLIYIDPEVRVVRV
jgi:ATP-dependent exoDNAse (exonuclease V) beta subunit